MCCGPPEGGPKHGNETRRENRESRRWNKKTKTENRENERTKPKRQHNGARDAKVLVGYGGGG